MSEYPVDDFKTAAPLLRRPFTPEAVKFKVQATYKQNTGALIVAYIDSRLAVERLNLIVPHLWHDEYFALDGGLLLCRLTVDGITRHDVGSGYVGKGLYSDALKRAAVKFGIGVSLYAIPQTHLSLDQQQVRVVKTKQGDSLAMTAKGEQMARTRYREWLTSVGIEAFGEPLSHGDVEGAQGDAETEDEPVVPAPEPLAQNSVNEIIEAIKQTKPDPERVREKLIDLGVENVPEGNLKLGTLQALSADQAVEMVLWLTAGAEVVTS